MHFFALVDIDNMEGKDPGTSSFLVVYATQWYTLVLYVGEAAVVPFSKGSPSFMERSSNDPH